MKKMDDYTQYNQWPEDRRKMDFDIAVGGQGITASLLLEVMTKHGWTVAQVSEWYSKGETKAEWFDNKEHPPQIVVTATRKQRKFRKKNP